MKKKIMASLLVGSAVVGASLAPLSAQAVTTGNTPVTVGVEGEICQMGMDLVQIPRDQIQMQQIAISICFIFRENMILVLSLFQTT